MRQWKWCQQGLGFPGPHYTGGLRERIILIHSYFESFSTAFTCCWWWWFQVLGALVFALFWFLIVFFFFPWLRLMTVSFTLKNELPLEILLAQKVTVLLLS